MELVTSLPGDLWPILADPGQIEQVLVNLAVNARDAMPGGGTLRIDTANVVVDADSVAGGSPRRPGRHVRLRVSDTGTGMSPDVIGPRLRAVLHHQGRRQRDRPGPRHRLRDRHAGRGHHRHPVRARRRDHVHDHVPGHRRGRRRRSRRPATYERDAQGRDHPGRGGRGGAARGDRTDLHPQRLSRDHRRERSRGHRTRRAVTTARSTCSSPTSSCPRCSARKSPNGSGRSAPTSKVLYMSGYAQPVLASQGRLEPGVALVDKPFSAAALLAKAGQVLNGHFQRLPQRPQRMSRRSARHDVCRRCLATSHCAPHRTAFEPVIRSSRRRAPRLSHGV